LLHLDRQYCDAYSGPVRSREQATVVSEDVFHRKLRVQGRGQGQCLGVI